MNDLFKNQSSDNPVNDQQNKTCLCPQCYESNFNDFSNCIECGLKFGKNTPNVTKCTCKYCTLTNTSKTSTCLTCCQNKIKKEEKIPQPDTPIPLNKKTIDTTPKTSNNTSLDKSQIVLNRALNLWYKIVTNCRLNGKRFFDQEFPPNDRSLSKKTNLSNSKFQNLIWCRPQNIKVSSKYADLKWSVYDKPKISDIRQGRLGDCWLLSGET